MVFNSDKYFGVPGCYAFFNGKSCIYVGKATCLSSRVLHQMKRFNSCNKVKIYDYSKVIDGLDISNGARVLSILEAMLINELSPCKNKHRPDFTYMIFEGQKRFNNAQKRVVELFYDIALA